MGGNSIMRICEVYNDRAQQWVKTDFDELVIGNLFRLFDNGERYICKEDGSDMWVVVGRPFINGQGYIMAECSPQKGYIIVECSPRTGVSKFD